MSRKFQLVLVITVIGMAIYLGGFLGGKYSLPLAAAHTDGLAAAGYANPAAIYCQDLGYTYQVVKTSQGDIGKCKLPEGLICDDWDFLAGKCGEQFSICAQKGYILERLTDGNDPFSPEYAVCVSGRGEVVGTVTELSGLAEKSRKLCNPALEELIPPEEESLEAAETFDGVLPTAYGWHNVGGKNRMTNVRDQGICGSCWAFSAVGITEAALNIANNKVGNSYDLSEEYLVSDCHMSGGYQTCCGGSKDIALTYIKNSGIPNEACMPYVDGSGCACTLGGPCPSSCTYYTTGKCSDRTCSNRCAGWASQLTKIATTGKVPAGRDNIKQYLINKGPLAVSIKMGGTFDANKIYHCNPDTPTNHAVVIVGYNNTPGYWWVKNSWGTSFGTNGYFKIGYGECSIEGSVFYATAAGSPGTGFYTHFTNADGWTVHKGVWSINGGTNYYTTGFTDKFSTVSHSGNYSTLTYTAKVKRVGCSMCANHLSIRGDPNPLEPLYALWNYQYIFEYTNDGYTSVWRLVDGKWTALQNWTTTTFINNANWNTLKVTASGTSLKFYINGHLIWSGTDSFITSGLVGMGMFRYTLVGDKFWVDWAKVTTTVADTGDLEVLVPGVLVPGGDPRYSPE
jgi:C1A family cysteine protease/putative hemolysin